MTGGIVLMAVGLVSVLAGQFLGPRYRKEHSEYLASLDIQERPQPLSAPTSRQAAARGRSQSISLVWGGYAAIFIALPSLAKGHISLFGPLFGAVVAGLVLPWIWGQVAIHRRQEAMDQAVGDLVSHLRLQTSVGITLVPALVSAPSVVREPLRQELVQLLADVQISPLPTALQRFSDRSGSQRVQSLVRHLQHQSSLGIPLEQVLAEEEQHFLAIAREEARQRIRSATVTMAVITFVLFMNGALVFATPLAIQAFRFLGE